MIKDDVVINPSKNILKGAKILYDAVSSTAGAAGSNVLVKHGVKPLMVTKDGWTVANSIDIQDPEMAIGAEALLAAASSANAENGDGSTATVVLAYHLLNYGTRAKNKFFKPNVFKMIEGINFAAEQVIDNIRGMSTKEFSILDVAMISTNNDNILSEAIEKAFELVGANGSIKVESSNTYDTEVIKQDGVAFKSGWASPMLINMPEEGAAKYNDALVLIVDHEIEDVRELKNYMLYAMKAEKPLIVIANDFNRDVLNFITANKTQKNLPFLAIKAPFFGVKRTLFLKDLSNMIGGTAISEANANYRDMGLKGTGDDRVMSAKSMLGSVKSVYCNSNETVIHYTSLNEQYLDSLAKELGTKQNFIEERYNILSSMVATIRVGALTNIELSERLDRCEDALNSVRASINNGVVIGGGLALYRSASMKMIKPGNRSELIGFNMLLETCRKPALVIMNNSGYYTSLDSLNGNLGLNVLNGNIEDFIFNGIIDPTDVVIGSLKHSVSVVKTLLTASVAVFNTKR